MHVYSMLACMYECRNVCIVYVSVCNYVHNCMAKVVVVHICKYACHGVTCMYVCIQYMHVHTHVCIACAMACLYSVQLKYLLFL